MSKNFACDDLFDLTIAKSEVIRFLDKQDEAFFEKYGTTKETILNDKDKIDDLATEHYRCVTRYGNDREWSVKDACTVEPGIWELDNEEKAFPALEDQIKDAKDRKQPDDPPHPTPTEMVRD